MKKIRCSLRRLLPLVAMLLALTFAFTACSPSSPDESTGGGKVKDDNDKIMILFTSDVHCGVDQGFGMAGLYQVRAAMEKEGYDVLLVDDGDFLQGDTLGTLSKGQSIIDIMNEMDYDAVIPGNHEFDYGMDRFLKLAGEAKFPIISCNFNKEEKLLFDPYVIKEVNGLRIAFVGVTTPETLASSTPKYFQNEKGEYIYGFMEDDSGQKLYDAVQKAVDDARAEGVDYVYLMGHLGNSLDSAPWTYADVLSHTNGIDVMLDGHSHDTDQVVMKNKDGKDVVRSACGTKMEHIGYSVISPEDGIIDTNIWNWTNNMSLPEMLGVDNKINSKVEKEVAQLNDTLSVHIGETTVDLITVDPRATDENGNAVSPVRLVRIAEANMGDFCTDAIRSKTGADIALLNGGAIRADIPKGEITLKNVNDVFPFSNYIVTIEATGQQILNALEWGARTCPQENGGFLQVSGLTYEIDTTIKSGCQIDDKSAMKGIEGERRVKNVKIGDQPIDPDKTYTVSGGDYLLLNSGDGNTAFKDAKALPENTYFDVDVLSEYIKKTLGGTVGEEYEDPYGQGRITVK